MEWGGVLRCINCWWSTPTGRRTRCRRCKEPLYASNGRRVLDVIGEARQQAAWFGRHGYHPGRAPAAVQAAVMLGAPARAEVDWVGIARALLAVVTVAAAAVLLAVVVGLRAWAVGRYGSWLPELVVDGAGLAVGLVVVVAAWITMWLTRFAGARLTIAAAMVLGLGESRATVSIPVIALGGCLAAVLLMSVAVPERRRLRPGR
jgi:hypothetical protein